jgi:hypothetical protein
MDAGFFAVLWGKVKALLVSRKLWAAVGATVVMVTTPGIDPAQMVNGVAAIWIAFILATAFEDGVRGSGR